MVDSQLKTESQKNLEDDSESVNSYQDMYQQPHDVYTESAQFVGNQDSSTMSRNQTDLIKPMQDLTKISEL